MSENPYAPPGRPDDGDEVPDAPLSTGWMLDGGRLMVRQDAQLPMVDPFSGVSEERMTLRSLPIRYSPSWHRMTFAGAVLGLAGGGFFRFPHGLSPFLLISGAAAITLYLISGVFLSSVRIRVFTTRASNLKARMGNLINAMMAVTLASLIFAANSGRIHPAVSTGIAMLFGLSLIASISFRMLTWRLTCRKKTGDRYEVRGLHPDAFRFLGERFSPP
ncbi:hypothetical protein OVA24_03630 [Luteolibacter sp. SL250]|uniref:hypothetical protein n=1 Tax=Luteolibacter sp. SL250 TaxID=2995170 RepID=UPI00226F6ACC|nr:hypothetical protein [Luteolibacter sp. SL250]WAC20469.1 hypothetical protein OVA24_03630 [Luteolibacter sp. SL250]